MTPVTDPTILRLLNGGLPSDKPQAQIAAEGAAKRSEGVNPDGSIPGYAGNLDRSKAGDNWSTIGTAENGLNLTRVVPGHGLIAKNPAEFLGQQFRQSGNSYGAFETDQAGAASMNSSGLKPVTDPNILKQLNGSAPPSVPIISPPAQNIRHTGWAGNVADAMSGASAPQPIKAPTGAELGQQWGNVGKGVVVGVPSGVVGTPGDVEGIGRLIASKLSNISPQTTLPTSADVGNFLGGSNPTPEESGGRILGNFLSPPLLLKGASLVGKAAGPLAAHSLGATTGAGGEAIKGAFNAGRAGGDAAAAFEVQMRGGASKAPEVVQTARDAVEQMRLDRSNAYKAGIGSTIKGDPTILDFAPIDKAIRDVSGIGMYQGKSLSSGADKVWNKIENVVDDWRQSDPATFHTPEGLDALKKKISNLVHEEDLKTVAAPGTPGSVIVNNVYNTIKDQISAQAPGYAKVMKNYTDASDELRNVEQTLSLKPNANIDTSLRKLQSIMRNNANTNYGQRVQLGNTLDEKADGMLMPQLAGQALSSPVARGIQGPLSGAGGLTALFTNPQFLPALLATSPRLIGESAYALGKALPNANKGAALGAGNAGVARLPAVDPKVLGLLSPQVLSQLLLQTPAQAR